jgi:general secretion pathway protein A
VDAYETHFGFSEPPFSVTPDPRFFYANPGYREAYATLRYGVEARKGFVVVTGEAGTGKTTLLRMLMENAGSSINTAFIFNPPYDFSELLRMILAELEVPTPSQERLAMLAQFNEYLLGQLRKRRIVALLIDEAQALSESILEELRLLSNLETSKEKLIQIVLMGQPELEGKLDRAELRQLKQRVALRCRLEPLDVEDVSAYIDFRLKTAGYQGKALFDAAGIEKITRYSQGIPRLINVICESVLLRAYKNSESQVPADMIEEAAHELRLDQPRRWEDACGAAPKEPAVSEPGNDAGRGEADYGPAVTAPLRYDFDAGERGEAPDPSEFRRRRMPALLPVGIWLAVFLIAATGLALHTRYNDSTTLTEAPHPIIEGGRTRAKNPYASSETGSVVGERAEHAVKLSPTQPPLPPQRGYIAEDLSANSPGRADNSELSRSEPQARSSENEAAVSDSREARVEPQRSKTRSSTTRIVKVVGASFVRETPRSDAEITTTLEAGTRVQVVGKAGDYFRVRALDGEPASGYVHQEDAFFEPSR